MEVTVIIGLMTVKAISVQISLKLGLQVSKVIFQLLEDSILPKPIKFIIKKGYTSVLHV